ncbi:transcription antitermination factor NusB [Alphaproteobacteria bacterium]|nr:transcription antitermination factor NusB [Alphaproteobacteria bacterium]
MSKVKLNIKENVRHNSILKKTASRICSTQVLYGASFVESDIDLLIKSYVDNYLPSFLIELGIRKIDIDLFNSITKGVYKNISSIDSIISKHLSEKWSFNRLSETEKSVLRLATYELCYDKKFKKIIIINEYISIIESFGGNPNFANGILENISK